MDRPPESLDAEPAASLSIEDALALPDPSPDPEAETTGTPGAGPLAAPDYSDIVWPPDGAAPDYAWLEPLQAPGTFTLTPDTLEALFRLGRYVPSRDAPVIAFALRGAALGADTVVTNASEIAMEVAIPDHRRLRCVLGFYAHGARRLSAVTGSTVPCRKAIYGSTHGGEASNMLPTGMYAYYVWRHKQLSPALRLSRSKSDLEGGAKATVLRNTHGSELDTSDLFDLSTPYDNVHCSYYLSEQAALGAEFSLWGCLTVRGTKTPWEGWKTFQAILGDVGLKSRVDLLLSTGKEAALVAAGGNDAAALDATLGSLRQGSRGDEVGRAQQALDIEVSGFWGAGTADSFTGRQRLKDRFGDEIVLNGHPEQRLPNTLNISFVGRIGSEILAAMPVVAASTGSACHSGQVTLSPVLAAMDVPPRIGMGAIRFSLGRDTTADEVDRVVALLTEAVPQIAQGAST